MLSALKLKIIRNAASNFAGTFVNLLVTFFLTPFIINHLGLVQFGIWAIVNSIVGYMGLLDLGLNTTLVKKTSEYYTKDDKNQLLGVISNIFNLYFYIGLIIGISIIIISFFLPHYFHVPKTELNLFRSILILVGIQTALSFPMSVWSGIITGLQEFHIINAVGIANNIIKSLLIIILLKYSFGLFSLVFSSLLVSICIWIFYYILSKKRLKQIKINFFIVQLDQLKEIFKFSGSMIIWSIAGYSVHQLDKIIIGILLPISNVSIYEVGSKINIYSRGIIHNVISVIFPTASELSATGDQGALNQLYIKGTRYIFLAYSFVFSCVMIFGQEFINLWLGQRFYESVIIMQILVFSSLIQSHNVVAHVLLPGMNKLKIFSRVMLAYPLIILATLIIFIKIFGLMGAALAVLSSILILESFFNRYIQKTFATTWKMFFTELYLSAIITFTPSFLIVYILKRFIIINNWASLITYSFLYFVLCTTTFILLAASVEEKKIMKLFPDKISKYLNGK